MDRRFLVALALLAAPLSAQTQFGTLGPDEMRAHFVNVGQGDATILEFACGLMLVDAGRGRDGIPDDVLTDYLRRLFAERPDLSPAITTIIATHNHEDHTLLIEEVAESFPTTWIVENGIRRGSGHADIDAAHSRHNVSLLDVDHSVVTPGGVHLSEADLIDGSCTPNAEDPIVTILAADPPDTGGTENNYSVVSRIDFGEVSFLFTGDLQNAGIQRLLNLHAGTSALNVDVYQVGHHGANNGTTDELLTALSPEIAVFSMGACDHSDAIQHGHPRDSIVQMVRSAVTGTRDPARRVRTAVGAGEPFRQRVLRQAVYGTGWDGDVVIVASADGTFEVITERPPLPTCNLSN